MFIRTMPLRLTFEVVRGVTKGKELGRVFRRQPGPSLAVDHRRQLGVPFAWLGDVGISTWVELDCRSPGQTVLFVIEPGRRRHPGLCGLLFSKSRRDARFIPAEPGANRTGGSGVAGVYG